MVLLRSDPHTRGPQLFAEHCAACHRFDGHNGLGIVPTEPAASSDLWGFGTRGWVRGLLDDPMAERYFGLMRTPAGDPAHTKMARFIDDINAEHAAEADQRALLADFDGVAAYLEFESRNPGALGAVTPDGERSGVSDPTVDATVVQGQRFFARVCNECHSYAGSRTGTLRAPEMLGYGSVEWIERLIADPGHDSLYRSRGREPARMPAFMHRLSLADRRVVAQWLYASGHGNGGA